MSEPSLSVLLGWRSGGCSIPFIPPSLQAPIGIVLTSHICPVQQDVLVSQDRFQREPATTVRADVTFRCHTGDYILFVYGRLPLDRAADTGRLVLEGNRAQAVLFNTLFRGV